MIPEAISILADAIMDESDAHREEAVEIAWNMQRFMEKRGYAVQAVTMEAAGA